MAAFPALNILSSAGSGLAARGPKLGAPPKGPTTRGVGRAGSALLGLAGNLTQPRPPAAAPPAANTAPTAPEQPTGAGGSPLDSTYYGNVNDYLFKTNNQIAADRAKIGTADTALQTALGNLAYQQPRDALKLEQGANAHGGLFSSVYGQDQGNLQHTYAGKRFAAQSSHDNTVNGLTTAISQLQQSIPLYDSGQYAAAVQRAAAAAEKNPALGETVPAPALPAANPTAPARTPVPRGGRGHATGVGSSLLNLAGNLSKGRRR